MNDMLFLALVLLLSSLVVDATNDVMVLKALRNSFPDHPIRGIVDVGANKGNWATAVHNQFYQSAKIVMIEPSLQHKENLEETIQSKMSKFGRYDNKDLAEYHLQLLSDKDGQVVSFYNKGSTGDSMFQENTKHFVGIQPVTRTTMTLDTVIAEQSRIFGAPDNANRSESGTDHNPFAELDYLKLDVQGAELLVLQGATKVLEHVTFVQWEGSLVEYNLGGSACVHEVDEFLRRHGFYLYDIGDVFRKAHAFNTPGIGQYDLLYIKPSSPHLPAWLRDNNYQVCGATRPTKPLTSSLVPQATEEPNSTTSTLTDVHPLDHVVMEDAAVVIVPVDVLWSVWWSVFCIIGGLCLGYGLGARETRLRLEQRLYRKLQQMEKGQVRVEGRIPSW